MLSHLRQALPHWLTLPFLSLSLAACAGMRPTPPIPVALPCGDQIPPSYRQPISGAPLPSGTVGSLAQALDGQTQRLDQANGRVSDTIAIVGLCDAANAKLTTPAPVKKFLGLF